MGVRLQPVAGWCSCGIKSTSRSKISLRFQKAFFNRHFESLSIHWRTTEVCFSLQPHLTTTPRFRYKNEISFVSVYWERQRRSWRTQGLFASQPLTRGGRYEKYHWNFCWRTRFQGRTLSQWLCGTYWVPWCFDPHSREETRSRGWLYFFWRWSDSWRVDRKPRTCQGQTDYCFP